MNDLVTWLRDVLDQDEIDRLAFEWGPHSHIVADIEAKRAIVGLHSKTVRTEPRAPFNAFTGERQGPAYDVDCNECGWVSDDPASACKTVRLLASAYADRPGYREEWRP